MRRNGFGNSCDISEGVTEFIIFENRFWLFPNLNTISYKNSGILRVLCHDLHTTKTLTIQKQEI